MKNSSVSRVLWIIVAVAVIFAGGLSAQETTGGIKGLVGDEYGSPIAGAIVNATGGVGTVSTVSGDDGRYRFPRLAPGQYTVATTFEGFQPAETAVNVALGQATTVNFSLQQAFSEEINVYADTVSIDFTESQTELSVREWEIDHLPRGRDFTDVVTFCGRRRATERPGRAASSIDGASGLENRFIIDGLDTTDPQIGESSVPIRAEMMEEVQVGEFSGLYRRVRRRHGRRGQRRDQIGLERVLRLALRRLRRQLVWNGAQRPEIEYDLDDPSPGRSRDLQEGQRIRLQKRASRSGGPILRDRLWFFASYMPGIRTTERYVDWVSLRPPDLQVGLPGRLFIDGQPDGQYLERAAVEGRMLNLSPYETDGLLPNPDGRADLPDRGNYAPLRRKRRTSSLSYLNADWIASDNFVVSGRVGYYKTNSEDTGVPLFDLIHNYDDHQHFGILSTVIPR